jgi:hypothetical protein
MTDQPDLFGGASLSVRDLLQANAGQFRDDFPAWLEENGHVWERFCTEVRRILVAGRKHYSARTIIEVLRHESALADTGGTFKLNDHYTPDMARLALLTGQAPEGFFETRVPKVSERTA